MTPTEIETIARQKYNAVGDTFFSQDEVLSYMYEASLRLAQEALLIEATTTTSTVAGTQAYNYPTRTISIKRVTYDDVKLQPITMREDDSITGSQAAFTTQGTPTYYFVWDSQIYLRPIPDAVETLKIFTFNEPATIAISDTLEIPSLFHADIVNYCVAQMAAKDSNINKSTLYFNQWELAVQRAVKFAAQSKRGDAAAHVTDEEFTPNTILGAV